MGIINSKIVEDRKQAHDQRYITEMHTDHLGGEHVFTYAAELKADASAVMANRVTHIEQMLIEREIDKIVEIIQQGGQVGTPEFASVTEVKAAAMLRTSEVDVEIAELTDKKTYLEGVK